jgi:hypothetical protein
MKIKSETTILEQFSYIGITLRETVLIILSNSFPQVRDKLWKLRKTNKC